MTVTLSGLGVVEDQVGLKGLGLRANTAVGGDDETRSIENELVVAADLVHHRNRNLKPAGDGLKHLETHLALAHVIRRGGNVDEQVHSLGGKFLHRVALVKFAVPKLLVVPDVLADGDRHARAVDLVDRLAFRRLKVAPLVEDIVGRQKHLALPEGNPALGQIGSAVGSPLRAFAAGVSHVAADDVDAERRRLGRQPLQLGLISIAVGADLDEVLRRIAAERKFREGNQ